MRYLLILFYFSTLVYCQPSFGGGTVYGNMGYVALTLGDIDSWEPYGSILEMNMNVNTNAFQTWSNLYLADQGIPGGGFLLPYTTKTYSPLGDHMVIIGQNPNSYGQIKIAGTMRVDAQGWATVLWEFTNLSGTDATIYPNNNGHDTVGSNYATLYTSSDGDQMFSLTDDWVVIYDANGISPITGFSFGRGSLLEEQGSDINSYKQSWGDRLDLSPNETQNLLEVILLGSHSIISFEIANMQMVKYQLHSVLTHERNFYNYVTADGYRLLDHLTYNQLFNTANWNFLSAGIAGKIESDSASRVVRLDGSIEQISPESGVYCLFEDRVLQVNCRLNTAGVVDEVVVFAREHGMHFHASLDFNGQPQFVIDDHSVDIPMSRFNGNLVTESAPFQVPFTHIPLSALGEYHLNSLHFRDIFTVVGGSHPDFGGFFNVAVHRRASENRFPGLLHVPSGSELRDVGFGSSVVPDIWFDLSN